MIQLSLQDLLEAYKNLKELGENKFPARTSFKIARIISKLREEVENFNKIRNDIFIKYGEIDSQGKVKLDNRGAIKVKQECQEQFNQEVSDLLLTEIEIAAEPLKIEELQNISISPNKLATLNNFIVE